MNARLDDVMIVDDDLVCLRLLETILKRHGCRVSSHACPLAARDEVKKRPPNVLITDWNMPRISGGDLCRAVRQLDLPHYVYTIILTSSAREFVVRALDSGADDFITKPINPDELTARLRAGKRILQLENRLIRLTENDSLTGLYNRPTFFRQFQTMFRIAREEERVLSCAMLDLDHFKTINDTYGHRAGDDVLAHVGEVLAANTPKGCVIGRIGGEEFAIAALDTTAEQAEMLTYDIRHALSLKTFDFGNQQGCKVTASFGVSELTGDFSQPPQLLNAADQNLLMAKRIGRDRTVTGRYRRCN